MSKNFSSDFMEYCRKRENDKDVCSITTFWKNAKEEVPVDKREILVCFAKDLYGIGYFNADKQVFCSKEHYEINPIAWADIPECKL